MVKHLARFWVFVTGVEMMIDDGCPNLNRGDPARTTTNRQLSLERYKLVRAVLLCFHSKT